MVVERRGEKLIAPIFFAIILLFIKFNFGNKIFIAAFAILTAIFLMIYNFKIGLYGATFLYVFLPDRLGLLMMFGLLFMFLFDYIKNERAKLLKEPLLTPVIFYLLIAFIATLSSFYFAGSARDMGIHLAGISFLFVFINTIDDKESLNNALTFLILAAFLVAIYGVLQYFTGVQIRREWVDVESTPDIMARVYSVFGNPNILAEYLVFTTPIAIGMMWQTKSIWKKFVFAIGSAIMLICILLTMSRGGWLAIAVAALMFCILIDIRLLWLAIPAVLLVLMILPASYLTRLTSITNLTDTSIAHRFQMWDITINMIQDRFFAGVGFGHLPFKMIFETYIRTIALFHTHNSYMQTLAETGIAGFVPFIMMLYTFIKYPIVRLMKAEDKYFKTIGAGVISGLTGILMHAMFDHIFYLTKIIFTFWIVIAILITMMRISGEIKTKELSNGREFIKIIRRRK
ncbi:MAG: O-antigen ligase family protein [Tissierellia bacterium]|nr:O-antigen ligase family protein [Tissierellia bacterium]